VYEESEYVHFGKAIEASRAEILQEIISGREKEEQEALKSLNIVRDQVKEATKESEALKAKLDEADQKYVNTSMCASSSLTNTQIHTLCPILKNIHISNLKIMPKSF
jgi:flagellar biosynthesis/type III secretory pathway chaperone